MAQTTPNQQRSGGRSSRDPAAHTRETTDAAAASELAALQNGAVYAIRLGCVLHILHIAITAGLTSIFFMGPLGKGSWHEWERDHVFSLLGMVWYNLCRSNASNTTWEQYKTQVAEEFPGHKWKKKFVKPAETRWMVVFEGATLLHERWEQVKWLFCSYASTHLLLTVYKNYWAQSALMLSDPYIRLQVAFTAQLGELLFLWAYRWLRGNGGYFLRGEGVGRNLFPGMRLVEVADFSLLFLEKLEMLRLHHEVFFPSLLLMARTTLPPAEVRHGTSKCVCTMRRTFCGVLSHSLLVELFILVVSGSVLSACIPFVASGFSHMLRSLQPIFPLA